MPGRLLDLLKVFGNIGLIVELFSNVNNDGAVLLLDGINDLISRLCTVESRLIMLKFSVVEL